jgi:hypothetical protein
LAAAAFGERLVAAWHSDDRIEVTLPLADDNQGSRRPKLDLLVAGVSDGFAPES